MKLHLLVLMILFSACNSDHETSGEVKNNEIKPLIKFSKERFDLGPLTDSLQLKGHIHINFENISDDTLIFINSKGPCGCYVIKEFPGDLIVPGYKGEITFSYDFHYKTGLQDKITHLYYGVLKNKIASEEKKFSFPLTADIITGT